MNHPMLNEKRIAAAVLSAMSDLKVVLPTRDVVQRYRTTPAKSTQKALEALAPWAKDETSTMLRDKILERASDNLKAFRKLSDNAWSQKYPHLAELWRADVAAPVFSGGNVGKSRIAPTVVTTKELLAQLNALCKKRNLPPYKTWKGSRKQLEQKIEKVKAAILADSVPAFPSLKTVVANGAYKSSREAVKKTGHTESGPSKTHERNEAKKQRIVAKHVAGTTNRFQIVAHPDGKKTAHLAGKTPGVVTLAELARQNNGDPKQWRQKARKRKKELERFEVAQYAYELKSAAAVLAIMQQDGRKK